MRILKLFWNLIKRAGRYLAACFPEFWTLRAPLFWSLIISIGMYAPAQVKELYIINAERVALEPGISKYLTMQAVEEVYLQLITVAFLVFWLRIVCYQILNPAQAKGWKSFRAIRFANAKHPKGLSLLICAFPQLVLFYQTFLKAVSGSTLPQIRTAFWVLFAVQLIFVLFSLGALTARVWSFAASILANIGKFGTRFLLWLNGSTPFDLYGLGGAVSLVVLVLVPTLVLPFNGVVVIAVLLLVFNLPYQPVLFWLMAGVFVVAIMAICFDPISAGQNLGPLGLLSLFACCLVLVTAILGLIEDRLHIPASPILIGTAVLFSSCDLNDNHLLTTVPAKPLALADLPEKPALTDLQTAFLTWLECRPGYAEARKDGRRYPVYLVAAQGGGLYAAYQSASFLAELQDRSPEFSGHIFAASGVSGGSVGLTVFSALTSLAPMASDPSNCAPKRSDAANYLPVGTYTKSVDAVLRNDFLSPVGAAMLFPDMIARLPPFPINRFDRTKALERSFSESFLAATKVDLLNQPVLNYWQPTGITPALFLNTIDVDTGRRMVITPFRDLGDVTSFRQAIDCQKTAVECQSPTLVSGMLLSARFPIVTPAGTLMLPPKSPTSDPNYTAAPELGFTKARFVDGGYFENSGLDTIADLIEELRRLDLASRVVFRVLTFDFPPPESPKRTYGLGEVASPIRALNSARSARIDPARNRILDMKATLWVDLISISLDDRIAQFPLGWTLSNYTFDRIACDLWDNDACRKLGRDIYDESCTTLGKTIAQENRRRMCLIATEIANPRREPPSVLAPPHGTRR